MTNEERNLPPTRGDVLDLADVVQTLSAKYRWTFWIVMGLVVALVGVIVAVGLGGIALVQVRQENQCVAALAAATADRTGALAPLNTAKSDAQDAQAVASADLIFAAITSAGETPAQRKAATAPDVAAFKAAHEAYQTANEAYKQAYAAHPPPKATTYHC